MTNSVVSDNVTCTTRASTREAKMVDAKFNNQPDDL